MGVVGVEAFERGSKENSNHGALGFEWKSLHSKIGHVPLSRLALSPM